MSRQIISIDFDGTLVEHEFPEIGKLKPFALETLQEMQKRGWHLILNTCREDIGQNREYLKEAVDFMKSHGIEFRSINENHLDDDFRKNGPRRKVYAKIYIDDRNFGGFPGWDTVAFMLLDVRMGRFLGGQNEVTNKSGDKS